MNHFEKTNYNTIKMIKDSKNNKKELKTLLFSMFEEIKEKFESEVTDIIVSSKMCDILMNILGITNLFSVSEDFINVFDKRIWITNKETENDLFLYTIPTWHYLQKDFPEIFKLIKENDENWVKLSIPKTIFINPEVTLKLPQGTLIKIEDCLNFQKYTVSHNLNFIFLEFGMNPKYLEKFNRRKINVE